MAKKFLAHLWLLAISVVAAITLGASLHSALLALSSLELANLAEANDTGSEYEFIRRAFEQGKRSAVLLALGVLHFFGALYLIVLRRNSKQ